MAVLDFTFERREELIARDSREEGRTEGIELGRSQGRTEGIEIGYNKVAEKMLKANRSFEEIMEFTELSEDELRKLANNLGV